MKECQREYPVDGVMTNKVPICVPTHPQILVLTYGDGEKEVDLNSLSNSKLTEEDFKKVPPVPQKLQEVVQFMMSGKQ